MKNTKRKHTFQISTEEINREIRPQDDFFGFVNSIWLKNNPIPETEDVWGSFYVLRDENRNRLHKLLVEVSKDVKAKKGSDRQKLRDFYNSGMDQKTIEERGIEPLKPILKTIRSITSKDDLAVLIAKLHMMGVGVFFGTAVELDEKKSDTMALYIAQSGLGLPEREYYLQDGKFADIREKYRTHIQEMFQLAEFSRDEGERAPASILRIETSLSKASMTSTECREVEKIYNKMPTSILKKLSPEFLWDDYFKTTGIQKQRNVIVCQPKFLKMVATTVRKETLADIKYYLLWHTISSFSPLLTKALVNENFSFYGKLIQGLPKNKPRWQRVYSLINSVMGDTLGAEYVSRYFSKDAKLQTEELIFDVKKVYEERIRILSWMSEVTKKRALKKLGTFRSKIGYPKKWQNYSNLSTKEGVFFENVVAAQKFHYSWEIGRLTRPIDRDLWFMNAHTVNAYYWPNQNEIVFPAGILQPPFFDPDADPAFNYGAIGAVIGHEMTHGFDDNGAKFDEKGNLKNWWSPADWKNFKRRAQTLVKQYNSYEALPGVPVNGKLTLGENIADLGGVVIAYYALKKYMTHRGRLSDIEGFTPEQRFFLGVAVMERSKRRDESSRLMAIIDPHAPAFTRVNGPLSNLAEFYEAFDVKKGDKLYREQKNRAKIW